MDKQANPPEAGDDDGGGSNRGPLVGLAVVVVLALIGWIVVHSLQSNAKIEDCMLEGRHDCVPLPTGQRG
jgi:hypothetical protein